MEDLAERSRKANEEYQEVLKWVMSEEDKVTERLKATGKYIEGLDCNSADYAYIYREQKARIRDIAFKYDLPNKAVWDKWARPTT